LQEPDIVELCRMHEGKWHGTYRHLNTDGAVVDLHEAIVICEVPSEGPYAYIQSSQFIWVGHEQQFTFNGALSKNRLIFESERISGFAWVSHHDPEAMFLRFTRKDLPDIVITEMINKYGTSNARMRTWQWFKNGLPFRRTLVDEKRITE
jgi:hypothetical protein